MRLFRAASPWHTSRMKPWPVLVLLFVAATYGAQALDHIAGEYVGMSPSVDRAPVRKVSVRADGTFRSELREPLYGQQSPFVYEGRVTVEARRVTLDWTLQIDAAHRESLEAGDTGMKSFREELIPVRWGKRLYLIDTSRGGQFVRDVVRGDEPRRTERGVHLLRAGDWMVPAPGRPEVPEDWKKEFPPDHFETRIARQIAYHRAEIPAGSLQGLAPGMLLTLFSDKYGATDVRVISVRAGASIIENPYGGPPLTKGTRVVSRIR